MGREYPVLVVVYSAESNVIRWLRCWIGVRLVVGSVFTDPNEFIGADSVNVYSWQVNSQSLWKTNS